MPADQPVSVIPSRRDVLRVGATVTIAGAVVTVLAGCGGKAGPVSGEMTSLSEKASERIAEAVTNQEVPVGQAKIFNDVGMVLSRPEQGKYVAFSDVCTHAGARITRISTRGNLLCPAHGSEFDKVTGDVKVGPANKGLSPRTVTVDGPSVTLA